MDICIFSTFWLLWTMLLGAFMHKFFMKLCFHFSWILYLEVECKILWWLCVKHFEDCQTVFHNSFTIFHSHQQYIKIQFLNILINTLFYYIHPSGYEVLSLLVRFAFPWALIMLNTFSWYFFLWTACIFFQRNVCSYFLPIFKLGSLSIIHL